MHSVLHSRGFDGFNGATSARSWKSSSTILFSFQGSFSAFATTRRHATSRPPLYHPTEHISQSAPATYRLASAPAISAATPPLAASLTRRKHRVFPNLPIQHPRQQSRLYLQQPPVAHPVIEQRMRHQRIHPQLVRPEKRLP